MQPMGLRSIRNGLSSLALALLLAAAPASVPDAAGEPKAKKTKAAKSAKSAIAPSSDAEPDAKPAAKPAASKARIDEYLRAKAAFERELDAYWDDIAAKRRIRIAKRRDKQAAALEDYVLTQPPVYAGPPRPAGLPAPRKEPRDVKLPRIPRVADFISAAREHFKFVPQRPDSDLEFKQAYARVASAAGLTGDQAVRIYAFETGGNGTYDVQAGLTHPKKGSKPISPAVGYNQLLSTNSIGLLAANGDEFVKVLKERAAALAGDERGAMERKVEALQRMIAHSRSVPYAWSAHDKMAKFTPKGYALHAAIFDRDIGPLLQTQKLLDSVMFARRNGRSEPLTAAELELMNFTGDGNGFDMVMMPHEFRDKVPTSNFFQPRGYSRNPIAKRTGTVAALIASIEAKMDRASQLPGAQELAAAFREVAASAKQAAQ
jgi:hypothetical protein